MNYFLKIPVLFLCSLLLFSCKNQNSEKTLTQDAAASLETQSACFADLDNYQADSATWKKVKAHFYRNKNDNQLYHLTCSMRGPVFDKVAIEPDFASFESFGVYAKDKNHVYYHYLTTTGYKFMILKRADPASFKSFGPDNLYGKDKNHVFYSRKGVIKNADAASFKPIAFKNNNTTHLFAVDKNNLYVWGSVLQDTSSVSGLNDYLASR